MGHVHWLTDKTSCTDYVKGTNTIISILGTLKQQLLSKKILFRFMVFGVKIHEFTLSEISFTTENEFLKIVLQELPLPLRVQASLSSIELLLNGARMQFTSLSSIDIKDCVEILLPSIEDLDLSSKNVEKNPIQVFFFTRDFPIKNFYKGFPFKMNQILIRDFPLKFTRDFLIKKFIREFPIGISL